MSWRSTLEALVGDLVIPLRALAVALLGVGLAWVWFNLHEAIAIVASLIVVLIGVFLERYGYSLLPVNPVRAVQLMEFWTIAPAAVAALAAMAVVVVSVALTAPKGTPVVNQELLTAISAALIAFLTSSFIDWTGDRDDSRTAQRIREHFYSRYKRVDATHGPGHDRAGEIYYFTAGSPGERWVYSTEFGGVEGWGYEARRKRAAAIAAIVSNAENL